MILLLLLCYCYYKRLPFCWFNYYCLNTTF